MAPLCPAVHDGDLIIKTALLYLMSFSYEPVQGESDPFMDGPQPTYWFLSLMSAAMVFEQIIGGPSVSELSNVSSVQKSPSRVFPGSPMDS